MDRSLFDSFDCLRLPVIPRLWLSGLSENDQNTLEARTEFLRKIPRIMEKRSTIHNFVLQILS